MRRKVLLIAMLAALATAVFGGAPPVATGEIIHPCWDIDKTATLHSTGQPVENLLLSLGQTIQVDYAVVVTKRECREGETPNDSVDVFDTYTGVGDPPGTLALHIRESQTFTYSRQITARDCNPFDVENTASVVDTVVLDTDTVTIRVTVDCGRGCTLTQGYWKTHSRDGPAPYDDNWANLGALQEDTPAFLPFVDAKGDPGTWISIFWTAPAGNVYYQLAHQYMAARLNILNGASSTTAVNTALAGAEAFFLSYTPAEAAALGKTSTARQNALDWASTLASYNEGAIGPGHCDE